MSQLKWSIFFILVMSFVLLFIGLGSWQWIRYQSKTEILNNLDKANSKAALSLNDIDDSQALYFYRKAVITGHFVDKQVYLIDNRILDHQVGFDVYALFQPTNRHFYVLIKLGWIDGRLSQSEPLPLIKLPSKQQTLKGFLAKPHKPGFYLGRNELNVNGRPKLYQYLDMELIQQQSGGELLPYMVVTDAEQLPGFKHHWVSMTVPPERHLGYSVQWFLLAFAVTMSAWFFVRKKNS